LKALMKHSFAIKLCLTSCLALLAACHSEVDKCVAVGLAAELESQQDQRIRLTKWEEQSKENTLAWDRFMATRPMECMDRESFYTSPIGAPHRKEHSFLRGGGDLRPGISAYEKHCQLSTFKQPYPDLAKEPPTSDTSSTEQIEYRVRMACMQATKK
jgi:hypothetical protein